MGKISVKIPLLGTKKGEKNKKHFKSFLEVWDCKIFFVGQHGGWHFFHCIILGFSPLPPPPPPPKLLVRNYSPVLVFLLLTLNIFHIFFHGYLWTGKLLLRNCWKVIKIKQTKKQIAKNNTHLQSVNKFNLYIGCDQN